MMEPSFGKLLVLLVDANVDFVLVGGLAVSLQGYVRFTEDVDLLVDASPENVTRLLNTLETYGEGCSRELSSQDFTVEEGAVRVVEEVEQCQMDLFTMISGRIFSDVIKDADTFQLQGRDIRYASKSSLIEWKEKSVREKDRLDVMALRRLSADPAAFD